MSSHKLEIDRAAGSGSVWIETDDIDDISPVKDGQHAAVVTVRWRSQYHEAGAFEYSRGGQLMRLSLLPRQVRAAVDQLREAQEGYCNGESGCWDFGKVERPPASCTRCLLIDACRLSGMGELRRSVPIRREGPGLGLPFAFAVLFGIWWWTLCQWSATARDVDQARLDLAGCRAKQSPTAGR